MRRVASWLEVSMFALGIALACIAVLDVAGLTVFPTAYGDR